MSKSVDNPAQDAGAGSSGWADIHTVAEHVKTIVPAVTVRAEEVTAEIRGFVRHLFDRKAQVKIPLPAGETFATAKAKLQKAGQLQDPPSTVIVLPATADGKRPGDGEETSHLLVSAEAKRGRPGTAADAPAADAAAADAPA